MSSLKMLWISLTKHTMSPSSALLNTSKRYIGTIADVCGGQAFNIGDLVLHLVQSNKDHHKLSSPWEGSYIVAKVLWPGTYKLKTFDGQVFTNA
jgi:hypothetical protein